MFRRTIPAPLTYVHAGTWPDAELRGGAPVEADAAQALARAVRDTQRPNEDLQEFARRLRVKEVTLSRLLAGAIYSDVVTLARMEAAVGHTLWPTRGEAQSSDK